MGKRKQYTPKEFESAKHGKQEPFSAIYLSMLMSNAWNELTAKQRELYLYCKLQLHADKRALPAEDIKKGHFTFNQYKWREKYKLYKPGNNGFYRDMDALINCGFVDCIRQGAQKKEKNVYRFSDRWQHYGTEHYKVPAKYMTQSLYRKTYVEAGHK